MGLFNRKKPEAPKPETPSMPLEAKPVTINASAKQKALRHAHRVHTIMLAIEQAPASLGPGTTVESLKEELKRRHGALISHGHKPPETKSEALDLAMKIERGGT